MAEQRVRLEGVTTTDQYLTVHFTIGDRQAKRVREVKVPWRDLLDHPVVAHVNMAEVARLKRHWETLQDELPWE